MAGFAELCALAEPVDCEEPTLLVDIDCEDTDLAEDDFADEALAWLAVEAELALFTVDVPPFGEFATLGAVSPDDELFPSHAVTLSSRAAPTATLTDVRTRPPGHDGQIISPSRRKNKSLIRLALEHFHYEFVLFTRHWIHTNFGGAAYAASCST